MISQGNQTMNYCSNTNFAFVFFLFSSLFLSTCCQSPSEDHEFNYDEGTGRGPSNWGTLKPEWRNCSAGREQSPINIGTVQLRPQLGDLQRNYISASASLRNRTVDVAVTWTGNAGSITINGTDYRAVNCHWHSPSEHTFNGTRYPLEIHIVHRSAQNKTAVVAILYRNGLPDPFLLRLFPFILSLGRGDRPLGPVSPESIGFPSGSYYRYTGSLTTPPCSEGVVWTVYQQTNTVFRFQVQALRNVLPTEQFKANSTTQWKDCLISMQEYFYLKTDNWMNPRFSAKVEYRSMAFNAAELTSLSLSKPPTFYCDSMSALYMSMNPVFRGGAKHIELDYHFVQEKVALGNLTTQFASSTSRLADIFTKPLRRGSHGSSRVKLGLGRPPPPPSLRGSIKDLNPLNTCRSAAPLLQQVKPLSGHRSSLLILTASPTKSKFKQINRTQG